jgi:hypothetical protein
MPAHPSQAISIVVWLRSARVSASRGMALTGSRRQRAAMSEAATAAKWRQPCPRFLRGPGESYSDLILRLAAVGHESLNRS